jgi:hypothetical protein
MPPTDHDAVENEEEVFAVLCIYSQLLFLGFMWICKMV